MEGPLAERQGSYDEKLVQILQSACGIFAEKGYHHASVRDVAAATGVSPAGLYYYFRSKEELFLKLLREDLSEWYSQLDAELDSTAGRVSRTELAELLATSLSKRPELTRFLCLEAVVLEQNLDAMEVFRLQHWRRDRMTAVGERLERKVDGLREGEGIRLLHRVQLLTAALWPAADPKGAATYEIGDPDFEVFAIDFEAEMKRLVVAMLKEWVKG